MTINEQLARVAELGATCLHMQQSTAWRVSCYPRKGKPYATATGATLGDALAALIRALDEPEDIFFVKEAQMVTYLEMIDFREILKRGEITTTVTPDGAGVVSVLCRDSEDAVYLSGYLRRLADDSSAPRPEPAASIQLWDSEHIRGLMSLTDAGLYALTRKTDFPKAKGGNGRARRWRADEVTAWINKNYPRTA